MIVRWLTAGTVIDLMASGSIRLSAYVLLTEDDQILLCRLSDQANEPGCWTIPGGGLEYGEDPEAGARREVFEETGLHVEITDLVSVNSRVVTEFQWVRIIYRGRVLGGELRAEVDGSTDMPRWIDRTQIASLELVELAQLGYDLAFQR